MEPKTYAEAGVDIHKAEAFVARLKHSARRDGHKRLWRGAGGYACVYPTSDGQAVALTTDGVGTKLLLALEQNKFDTIGIDLVAMCANDLLCVGARPVAFLDYYATGKLDENVSDALLEGIINGCDQAGMLLVGGETAELPDLYDKGHFDLAGFAMGTVSKESLITGEHVKPGDKLIGVGSSGIHSNGLSLARKLIGADNPLRKELLVPTRIYCKPFVQLLERFPGAVKGVAHITGGGWTNIPRPNDSVGYVLENHMPVPAVMEEMAKNVSPAEMYKTFNMGMGLCIMTQEKDVDNVVKAIKDCDLQAIVVGEVVKKPGLTIKGGLGEEQISL